MYVKKCRKWLRKKRGAEHETANELNHQGVRSGIRCGRFNRAGQVIKVEVCDDDDNDNELAS
jgi:hypothetical protein